MKGTSQRKVIQITVLPTSQLYALCDDGSLWYRANANWGDWNRVEGIPRELEGLDPESLKARGKVIEGLNAKAKNALRQAKWRAKKKLERLKK